MVLNHTEDHVYFYGNNYVRVYTFYNDKYKWSLLDDKDRLSEIYPDDVTPELLENEYQKLIKEG